MRKRGFKWLAFLLEFTVIVFAAALVVIARRGSPLESSVAPNVHQVVTRAVLAGFVVLLGYIENSVVRQRNKRNR